ncbi:hypothetical protein A4H97_00115 [Niastella yeongjuensis]|uniref:FAS1 domain-containing protein n=1 Tax=Niastella yeongjuensis TaxID=354355 RepID=A0A1V9EVX4_9BACT|nr:fasciclin domain-containing protein [Niastella yeongjuensis]OQP50289.1 hypothetical protein A4H97_00115 [Niastella yeongjuensis]SEN40991.1 Uncaracterized surface protein containing fasciclin (FAS1) repeats [Niastella yeongjuensis]
MNIFQIKWKKAWVWLLLPVMASCSKKDYNATPDQHTLNEYIQQGDNLTLFKQALQKTGLDTVLAKGGPYTVFAPIDSAFTASGLTSDKIAAYPADQLRDILAFHIIPGRIGTGSLTGFLSDSMQSLNKTNIPVVTQNYYGTFLNGMKVTQGNINLADGVLHKLSAIAFPANGDLLAAIDSLPNTKMAAWIIHHSVGLLQFTQDVTRMFAPTPPNFQGYHVVNFFGNSAPPYTTWFVPSDNAFKMYGYNSIDDLAKTDTAVRSNMLTSCILLGMYFTADFLGGRYTGNGYSHGGIVAPDKPLILNLANSAYLAYYQSNGSWAYVNMINTSGSYEIGNDGMSLMGSGITTPVHIIQPNIVSTTGIVHVIDQVFAPNGDYTPKGPQP